MGKIEFQGNDRLTVGIEIELGLVDETNMALRSAYGMLSARLTADGLSEDEGAYKPELMQ